jgi:HEAT repeat protein
VRLKTKTKNLLIESLKSVNVIERIAALKALEKLKTLGALENGYSIAPFIDCLNHEDEDLRCDAVHALGILGREEALEPLIKSLLDDPDEIVRNESAEALGMLGDSRAVEPLIESLLKDETEWAIDEDDFDFDPQWDMQLLATKALGRIADPRIIDPLMQLMEKEDAHDLSDTLLWSIGQVNTKRSLEVLLDYLKGPDALMRRRAIGALAKVDSPEVTKAILNSLEDEDPNVRISAAKAMIGSKETFPLDTLISLLKDDDKEVRGAVVEILSGLDNEDLSDILLPMLDDEDHDVCGRVAEIMGAQKESKAIDKLVAALEAPGCLYKEQAVLALGRIRSEQAYKILADLAKNNEEDNHIRVDTIAAIGIIGGAEAVDELNGIARTSGKEVCMAALIALQKIGNEEAVGHLLSIVRGDSGSEDEETTEENGDNEADVTEEQNDDATDTDSEEAKERAEIERELDIERKLYALRVLALIPEEEVILTLLSIVEEGMPVLRKSALESLSQMKEKRAIPYLLSNLDANNRDERLANLHCLCKLDSIDQSVFEPIKKALIDDKDGYCRQAAATAMGLIEGNDEVIDSLLTALEDENVDVKKGAVEALGAFKNKKAFDRLITALFDYHNFSNIRTSVALSLGKIELDKTDNLLSEVIMDDSQIENHWIAIDALKDLAAELHSNA